MILPATTARHGQVEVLSVEFHSPCVRIQNFQVFFGSGPKRGSDLVIPHAQGVRPRRRRRTSVQRELELLVAGDVDAAGDPYANYEVGIQSNFAVLDALTEDPGTLTGTRSMTVTWPSSATSTKDVHVLEFIPGDIQAPGLFTASLVISIPGGRF